MKPIDCPPTRVLVQHPEPLLSMGLAAALRSVPGLQVDPPDAAADVVVTDFAGALALAAQRRNEPARCVPQARILVLSARVRENDVRLALENGVDGFLLLGCALDELAAGVQALARGNRYLSMAVVECMADCMTRESLTARESDVLRLLARGECNKAIARQLDIAIGTVKTHVKSIMGKLDAASRTHAVTIAARRGLVDDTVALEASPPLLPAAARRAVPAAPERPHYV